MNFPFKNSPSPLFIITPSFLATLPFLLTFLYLPPDNLFWESPILLLTKGEMEETMYQQEHVGSSIIQIKQ